MWNNFSRLLFVALLVVAGLAAYFYLVDEQEHRALEQAQARNIELSAELAHEREQVAYLSQRLEQEAAKGSKEKQEELARLAQTHDEMVASLKREVTAGEVTITRLADRLSVKIVDRILFPSGEASLSDDGRKVLERVGQVLARSKDKIIRIEGHTDNVPIGKSLQDRFATNWELSAARATTVARLLQEITKMDPTVFEAVGLGEYHPVADNRGPTGRSRNRRIEIVLYPRVQSIAQELPAPAKRAP